MRYAIIADIHGNLEAFNAVLNEISDGDVDQFVCAGDIVGYGANPNECCSILRRLNAIVVLGNHDAVSINKLGLEWFNPHAKVSANWTSETLSKSNWDYLSQLEYTIHCEVFSLTHSSLRSPKEFSYIYSPIEANQCFDEMKDSTICFIGHTHIAEIYCKKNKDERIDHVRITEGGKIQLYPDYKYIVNCGSIGQPRDHNPRAAYALFDSENHTIEFRRVEYDIKSAQKKIISVGLPSFLAERLSYGS